MEENTKFVLLGIMIGILFMFIIGGSLLTIYDYDRYARKLGGAICEQEYNMEFHSYYQGELKCKDKSSVEKYDGITITKVLE